MEGLVETVDILEEQGDQTNYGTETSTKIILASDLDARFPAKWEPSINTGLPPAMEEGQIHTEAQVSIELTDVFDDLHKAYFLKRNKTGEVFRVREYEKQEDEEGVPDHVTVVVQK